MSAGMRPQNPSDASRSVTFNPDDMLRLYNKGDHDALGNEIIRVLHYFNSRTLTEKTEDMVYALNAFMRSFLFLLTQEDFVPTDTTLRALIKANAVICNLTAISEFKTTDAFLAVLMRQKNNFGKILALYNPRCRLPINRNMLFTAEPNIASLWYFSYLENYRTCCVGDAELERMREHLREIDPRLVGCSENCYHGYFGSTYVHPDLDRDIKRHINLSLQAVLDRHCQIENQPNPRRIAVFTAKWFPRHSVYRCMHGFLEALRDDYELVLVELGPARPDVDTTLFAEHLKFQVADIPPDVSAITRNDFALAFFPDVGMTLESIVLANLRIAPIQICGYGHPVSTFGSRIDYWLGGGEVEAAEDAGMNYTERLVLIPGLGVIPNQPQYTPGETTVRDPKGAGRVVVNCPWFGQKINAPHLARLREILARSTRPVLFRFFPGGAGTANGYLPIKADIEQALGAENVDVVPERPYPEYMAWVEQGDLSIDAYPFGGYATVADALHVGLPVVALEGRKFYNRSASGLLRIAGLPHLIAETPEAYIALILKLIDDEHYRASIAAEVAATDLDASVWNRDTSASFREAIAFLLENHETIKQTPSTVPIAFSNGCQELWPSRQ